MGVRAADLRFPACRFPSANINAESDSIERHFQDQSIQVKVTNVLPTSPEAQLLITMGGIAWWPKKNVNLNSAGFGIRASNTGKHLLQSSVVKPEIILFSPKSVTTTVKGGPTFQCIVVETDLVVVVLAPPVVQSLLVSCGPNVGSCTTQVLPQWPRIVIATARVTKAADNATKSFRFISDPRSYPFLRVVSPETYLAIS